MGNANIEFAERELPKHRKTKEWGVFGRDGVFLGDIVWRNGWRRYVFEPASGTYFDSECLEAIASHVYVQMNLRECERCRK
jgi:hypothetical protein